MLIKKMNEKFQLLSLVICIFHSVCAEYSLHLTSNSPVVRGGTVNFTAVLKYNNKEATGKFRFEWSDSGMPSHTKTTETESYIDKWNVTYNDDYPPGPYVVQVIVSVREFFIHYVVTSNRLLFHLTDSLNGELEITQGNKTIANYVSNMGSAVHQINLKESDKNYINNSSYTALTYWFIDCNYYGVTNNYQFLYNYTETEVLHKIEALVVAGYEPITTVAPTTTTSTTIPTTTTSTTTTTTTPITTSTSMPNTTSSTITIPATPTTTSKHNSSGDIESSNSTRIKRHLLQSSDVSQYKQLLDSVVNYNSKLSSNTASYNFNATYPFLCNNTIVPFSVNNTYGYFSKVVTIKAPVSDVVVTGNNWLQQGNMLKLNVNCKGSKTFDYCLIFYRGVYNVTGNETCSNPLKNDTCEFPISRYYGAPGVHTIVVVISNDVGKFISPVAVTVYKVQKQAQLSVIVVPVVFSLVAVVLIVFGVAYYIQNRTRFTVEVADFNFGPQSMEYMTFRERVRDSIVNAFTRASVTGSESGSGRIWPPSSRYGSMT